jgi:hypothetical protein
MAASGRLAGGRFRRAAMRGNRSMFGTNSPPCTALHAGSNPSNCHVGDLPHRRSPICADFPPLHTHRENRTFGVNSERTPGLPTPEMLATGGEYEPLH